MSIESDLAREVLCAQVMLTALNERATRIEAAYGVFKRLCSSSTSSL